MHTIHEFVTEYLIERPIDPLLIIAAAEITHQVCLKGDSFLQKATGLLPSKKKKEKAPLRQLWPG